MTTTTTNRRVTAVRFRVKDATLTPEQLLDRLTNNPKQASAVLGNGFTIEAERAVLDALHTTPLGQFVDDDGDVAVSAVGAAVAGALLVGFAVGFAVGYYFGSSDQAADTADTGDSGDSGDSGDTGDSGDGGDPGGSGG